MKGILLDVSYDVVDNEVEIILFVRTNKGVETIRDDSFKPHFYVVSQEKPVVAGAADIQKDNKGWKVFGRIPADIPRMREVVGKQYEIREFDIPFTQRYLIDKGLIPLATYEFKTKGEKLVSAKLLSKDYKPDMIALDIETYNQKGMSTPERDPIIMVSLHDGKKGEVLTYKACKKDFVRKYKDESEVLEATVEKASGHDIIVTYNGDNFDMPYIKHRIESNAVLRRWGPLEEEIKLRQGMQGLKARIPGSVHVDAYRGMRFLAAIGSLRLPRYTLEDVYKELLGKDKVDIKGSDIWKVWDSNKLSELCLYSFQDAEATYELGEKVVALDAEFCKLVGQTLFDISRMTSSQIVEKLLLKKAAEREELAPNKPGEGEVKGRLMKPIEGAFVKQPESGLHEDLVVLDFKGLYPSIIISHNIDPSTLECKCCKKDGHVSPNGHRFCKKRLGTVPSMLKEIVKARAEVKKKMKSATGAEKKRLNTEQLALKIIANSTYGYYLYVRSRWFKRECGESITAWGREYIHNAIESAEKSGFKVIYGDTDSLFLLRGKKTKKDVQEFVKKFNAKLPSDMELELEGFYPRGIFVTKKSGGAAKKRYALIRDDGQVEIKGLEFVRRDWSKLAKKTQREVIQAVLEARVEDAKKLVRKTIDDLQKGRVPVEELVIYTGIKRRLDKYEAIGPHVRAAKRLVEAGETVGKGSVIGYVVTKGSGTIGDRAFPEQLVGKREPDAEYYIDHQVLPAVMKILTELGVKEDEMKFGSKQTGLGAWS